MDRKKSYIFQYILIFVLGIIIAMALVYMWNRATVNADISYAPDYTVTDNPLMGYAPDSENIKLCEKANLVYIELTWGQWEPEEGRFDIEALEKRCNTERWKDEGKHAVLRFICDDPGRESHMDIPEWLYDKDKNGVFYDTKMGKGYAPDYGDPVFMKYHERALKALAEYCNRDHFVSFVELGSLGHWGEWHASDASGISLMPDAEICREYAKVYSENFINAKLLTRRNYDFAIESGMGIFNDMTGDHVDTAEWFDWQEKGGEQKTSSEPLIFAPVKDIGLTRPVGGEFTSGISMEDILVTNFGQVLEDITASRMTFVGPQVPDLTSKEYELPIETVLKRMGYRIYPSKLKTLYNFKTKSIDLALSFRNAGNAGFFFDWPVTVYVLDKDKDRVFSQKLDVDLRELSADEDIVSFASVPYTPEIEDEFYVGISITDHDGKNSVKLALDREQLLGEENGIQLIYHYERKA